MAESYKDFLASQQVQAPTIEPVQPSYKSFLNEQSVATPESGSYKEFLNEQPQGPTPNSVLSGLGDSEPRLAIDSSIFNRGSGSPLRRDPVKGAITDFLKPVVKAKRAVDTFVGEELIGPLALESEFLSREEIAGFKADDAAKREREIQAHNAVFREADPSLDPSFTDAVGKGVQRGVHGIGSTFAGLLGMGSEVLGDKESADFMQVLSQEQAGFARDIRPEVHPDGARSFKDKAVGVTELVSEQLPNLALTGGGGFVGGTAAKTLVTKAMTTAAKKKIIQKGTMLGTTTVATAMESAGNFNQILQETGKADVGTSVAHGLVSGWLEALPISRLMGKTPLMDKMVGEVTEDIIQKGLLPKLMDLAKVIPEQGLTEGVTEGLQTIISRHALEWTDKNKTELERIKESAFTPEARAEIAESVKQGATVGAVLGGGGSLSNVGTLAKQTPEKELAKLLENSQIGPDDLGPAIPAVTEGEFDSTQIDESELRLQEVEPEAPFVPSITELFEPESQIAPDLTTEAFTEGERALALKEAEVQPKTSQDPSNTEKFFAINRRLPDTLPTDSEVSQYDTLSSSEKNRGKVQFENTQEIESAELKGLIKKREFAQKTVDGAKGKNIKKANKALDVVDAQIAKLTRTEVTNVPDIIAQAEFGKTVEQDVSPTVAPTPKKQPVPEIKSFEAKPFQFGEGVTQTEDTKTLVSNIETTQQTLRSSTKAMSSIATRMDNLEADLVNMSTAQANKALKVINLVKKRLNEPLLTKIPSKPSVKPDKIIKTKDRSLEIKSLDTTLKQLKDTGPLRVEAKPVPQVSPPIVTVDPIKVKKTSLPVKGEGDVVATRLTERILERQGELTAEERASIPSSQTATNKDQIQVVSKVIANNPKDAINILLEKKATPKGTTTNMFLTGMDEFFLTPEGKASGLMPEFTTAIAITGLRAKREGQEIQALSTLAKDSPTRYILDLQQAKIEAIGQKNIDKQSKSEKIGVQQAIKTVNIKKGDLVSLAKSLRC